MLHVQESIPHSNSLIISQFLASAQNAASVTIPASSVPASLQMVQPQSSRSTKVIEQLQEKWERIQKEVATTRSHVESTKQAKEQFERQNAYFIDSNRQHRHQIQDLMSMLETKETTLQSTKRTSINMESQVKTLKDEAMQSRQQLEALRRQEQTLGKERDRAVAKKEQWEQHHHVLEMSLTHLETRLTREVGSLRDQLALVQQRVQAMTRTHDQLIRMAVSTLKFQSAERTTHYQTLSVAYEQLQDHQQHWLRQIQGRIMDLSVAIRQSGSTTDEFHLAFNRCRGEVHGLISKIKAYTAIMVE
ncbi:hypothetical protein BC940DRAFT_128540 [Gongronella butleri]|nr:hypothetical protein BC940DRAFT_128540 [Gongronella butleri]